MNKPPFLPSLVIRVVRSNKLTASTSRRLTLALIAVVVAGLAASSAAPPAAHFFAGTSPAPPAAVRLRTRVPARPAVSPRKHASAQADDATARGRAELNIERRGHAAIALGNGKVLIIGGENERGLVKESELFDLSSKSFSLAAELINRRTDAVAIRLPDGRVMVLGGRNQKGELKSTEIYDSESNSFTRGPKMVHARAGHTATELADGRILIAGGNAHGSAEIFDPSSLKFSRVAARMQSPRSAHSAILLKSAKVLIAGGLSPGGGEVGSGEIFDPETMQFSATRNAMKGLRTRPTLRVLPDGKVQVIGGDDARSMEMFNVEGRYFTAQSHLVPGDNSQTGLAEVMRAKTQAGLFHKTDRESFKLSRVPFGDRSKDRFSRLQDLMAREETLGDVLDRSEYTITELPGSGGTSGGVIVTGGVSGSGKVLRTMAALESSPATVTTDKTDYQPGDTVIISGTGWEPGETVQLTLHRDNGTEDTVLSAVAGQDGNISNSEYEVQESDLDVTFLLTAVGQTSGFTAQTTFTDSVNFQSIAIGAQTPTPVIAGNAATYLVTLGFAGSGNLGCSGTLSVITGVGQTGLPSGTSALFSPNPVASGGADQTSALTITTSAILTPAGTFTFTVQAVVPNVAGGQGCNGATRTATATLVISANCSAPTITCPPAVTVECDADVPPNATNLATFVAQGGTASPSSPACGPVTVEFISDVPSGTCPKIITRTYRATDAFNNTKDCTQIITVDDTIAPVATTAAGAGNGTLECSDSAGITTALAFVPAFSDNCTTSVTADLTSDQSTPDANCANAYVRVRKWTATDDCDNTSLEYTQTITVVDTTAPVATTAAGAGDGNFECSDSAGIAAALAFVPAFSDNCTASVSADLFSDQTTPDANCANAYVRVRRWTSTDGCANTGLEYAQTITVVDTTAPLATTAAGAGDGNFECSNTAGIDTALEFVPAFSDNCTASVSADLISDQTTPDGNCANAYVRVRKWTSTDGCANTSLEYTQTITVVDTTAPLATSAAGAGDGNFECSNTAGIDTALAFVPTFSDNCTASVSADLISDQTTPDSNCANAYVRVRKWTSTDGCANTSLEYTQTITVVDTTAPVAMTAAGAGDGNFECSNPAGIATSLEFVPAFSDNCTAAVSADLTSDQTTTDPDCANAYVRVRKWTANDACGNTSLEYTQTITVVDTTAPTITAFPPDTTVSCANAVPPANDSSVTATDNCGTVTITHDPDLISNQTCPNEYTITRKYHATDACGNVTDRCQTITVNDTTAPSITCPGNVTVFCAGSAGSTVTYDTPTASDNCGGNPTVVCAPPSGNAFPIGSTTVNCTATDSCGNINSCNFTVSVNYNFNGFFQPVDNYPEPNAVKAGQSVPLKFQLTCGISFISDINAVTSIQSANVPCMGGDPGDPIPADDSGASGLHYDYVANQFIYSWKTQKGWANTCRVFILTLGDGTQHLAYFKFKK
jgi:hypothetical protein